MKDKCVNNIRQIALQAIAGADNGHSGIVMSAAPIMYSLYKDVLNVNPKNPDSLFRDRFVMSAGHGSALLYSTLYTFGFNITKDDLQKFRKLGSKTPGHPEVSTEGVDSYAGPLGQGVAVAVGMAIAEKHLAAVFNKPDCNIIDNYTYALVGDGCLMEGVANEALSLAGTLKLNKLIVIYDQNEACLDSKTDIVFRQDTKKVFEGYGFNVIKVDDGTDTQKITEAILSAKQSKKPSLIIVKTKIGYMLEHEGSNLAHSEKITQEVIDNFRQKSGLTVTGFELEEETKNAYMQAYTRYVAAQNMWQTKLNKYKQNYKQDYQKLQRFLSNDFSAADIALNKLKHTDPVSLRDAGNMVLNQLAQYYDNIMGGTADVSRSTRAIINDSAIFNTDPAGKNIFYGVREFAMGAITSGINLYGGLRAFASTFAVFSDYMKNSIRMSALSQIPNIYILTHSGLDAGGDGPSHQAIESVNALRDIPNLDVFKPCDFNETKAAYYYALNNKRPTAIVLTKSQVKYYDIDMSDSLKGGYVVSYEGKGKLDAILLSAGIELELCIEAQSKLSAKGINVRVVNMCCMSEFDRQSTKYKNDVLPQDCKSRISVEMGTDTAWQKYTGLYGDNISINQYGYSAPYSSLCTHFGFTADDIVKKVIKNVKSNK